MSQCHCTYVAAVTQSQAAAQTQPQRLEDKSQTELPEQEAHAVAPEPPHMADPLRSLITDTENSASDQCLAVTLGQGLQSDSQSFQEALRTDTLISAANWTSLPINPRASPRLAKTTPPPVVWRIYASASPSPCHSVPGCGAETPHSRAADMTDTAGGDDGPGNLEVSVAVQNVADTSVLQKHIRKLVPLLLEDGGDAPAALEAALEEKSALEQMRKFLSDPQIHTVLVERTTLKEDVGDEGEEEREFISYKLNIDIHYGLKSNSLAFIKRTPVIDADKPISNQLRVLTLSEDSPYETLHSFISNAVAPFFKSYIRESGKADRDGDKMAPSVEKKIAELEMGLLHLQQNIEIPEISLMIHPNIINVAKQCYERSEKPKVTDFGDKVEDPTFLNQLQSGVNRWIREIQKVTKLDRDPASGTALQEISFWLNLERALYRIQEKRESPEVLLTLDILKHGKRFHATVSFDTDTGLKQALETVNDYNPLMKDFPLNDLLSATELDKIRQALVAIFTHLRKIRNTKYPILRALRLVEAISRDLSSQLLKVLGTRKLMHVAYEEFEKVMVTCFEVFQTWDDEYEKLQVLLRDIVKRKREENLKMVWRINPAHRKLQSRLDQMRKFRRQHEQLRAVIVRVLRPQ
ncbi:unnamed protein product, partial [Ranitomeya imitator]